MNEQKRCSEAPAAAPLRALRDRTLRAVWPISPSRPPGRCTA